VTYQPGAAPFVDCETTHDRPLPVVARSEKRWLLSNGGGKDTLAGMLLLNDVDTPYDIFEGCVPIGGNAALQDQLLAQLRTAVAPGSRRIAVSVTDDFYNRPMDAFLDAGVEVDFYKTDFAVGHTANYAGYFPLIAYHGYDNVWFNIEGSADDVDVVWNGEQINHEWCKSSEYRKIMTDVFRRSVGGVDFDGFDSLLKGFTDTVIYRLVASRPDLLSLTHSCNYNKPWCGRCPKCCFCYLMMSAELGEEYAQTVLGVDRSLLAEPSLRNVWTSLLSIDEVAWDCVASPGECALALAKAMDNGAQASGLASFVPNEKRRRVLETTFNTINWNQVPEILRPVLRLHLAPCA
jgi:hypothetical protein